HLGSDRRHGRCRHRQSRCLLFRKTGAESRYGLKKSRPKSISGWRKAAWLRSLLSNILGGGPIMHDLVIRGGLVVDGTGAPARQADIAIDNGLVTEVGEVKAAGKREIDAAGLVVTPGWVDIHTHYDGQVTWDPLLSPSCWHG